MIKLVTHYAIDDPDCIGDYVDIEVMIDDKVVFTAGVHHDKGDILAKGFIKGYGRGQSMDPMHMKIEKINIADREI